MRIQLAAAVALAPLMMASGAAAQTVINTTRTTPISTSTANNGAPNSITIANGGVLRVSSGAVVTLDSSHNVRIDNGGRIEMVAAVDGATAILAQAGNTGNITNDGAIVVSGNYNPTDSDNDGDLDGPYSTGVNRYGIHVAGPGVFTGDVRSTGSISVQGNQSAAIAIDSNLTGNLYNTGLISVSGDHSHGLHVVGDVSGNVYAGGTITTTGAGSVGAGVDGDIAGRFTVGGTITSTGFRYLGALTSTQLAALDADDLLIGGSAVSIAGNVGGGVVLDVAHSDITSTTDDDGDGILDTADDDDDNNGVPDAQESSANVTSYGSAPAVAIGSTTQTVTVGQAGPGAEAFGFINRGAVVGSGLYDGIAATGIRVGIDGGMAVVLQGGLRNEGTVESLSNDADSRAVVIGANAQVPTINNSGRIQSIVAGDTAFTSVGIDILAGATVNTLVNSGRIIGDVRGEAANAFGIRDASGTLTSLTNTGSIIALITPTDDASDTDDSNNNAADEVITGHAVAIDLSANTTGVSLIQDGVNDGDDGADGVPDLDSDGDGVDNADEPAILGDVVLGSGADHVQILNGTVSGNMQFGAGADTLLINGGAEVRGVIRDADGQLNIDVNNGLLDARQVSATTVSGLNLGADGDLIVTVDGTTGTAGGFIVNGTATVASGAGLGARFTSLLSSPTRFVVVDATTLTAGTLDQSRLQQNSPYMFVVNAGIDAAQGQIFIDARQRTASEFGFISAEASAYGAFYQALAGDSELLQAFLAQTGRNGFFEMYEQIVPEHSGGSLISLAAGVDAVTRALSGRGHAASRGETSAWLQEINFYADKERGEGYGFRSEGFGFAGGVERGSNLGALGLSFALTSGDLEDPESEAEEVLSAQLLELGLYWRAQGLRWNVWARGAVGYASFDSVRQLIAPGINRRAEGAWNGYSVALAAGAAYDYQTGRWSIRPEASIEYFRLTEDGYSESGGGNGFGMAYEDREGHILSSTVAMTIGAAFGENNWLRPELRVGWRQIMSHDPGATVASFISTGVPFSLTGDSLEGGGPIVGLRLNLGNELGFLAIEADAEMLESYVRYALLLRASFQF